MKLLLALSIIVAASLSLAQAGDYAVNITGKTMSNEAINVGKAWRTDLHSRYRVTLRSSVDAVGHDLVFKAYFFDADGKIITKQDGPNAIWTSTKQGTAEVGMPEKMLPGQLATVYIAIPPQVDKAKSLLVVFGKGNDLTYDIHPNSHKVEDLDFPEKAQVKK